VTLLKIMIHYGSPARLAADPRAGEQLAQWGRSAIKPQKIEQILTSARTTRGTPIDGSDAAWLQEIATELQAAIQKVKACRQELEAIVSQEDSMREYAAAVGAVTLCVIWAMVGNPRNYTSSGAFLKALGLNLKELSSGQRQGQLAITKRGPSLARKYLFFWALRAVQMDELKRWYDDFQQVGRGSQRNSEHRKMKGLVALMRKLSRSLWYACQHEEAFDYKKVFPGRPLAPRQRRRRRQPVQ
jgi:transposase